MSNKLIVIGLTGPARSGKDTAGNILAALYGFHRIALADGIKSAFDDLSGPTRDMHKDLSDAFTQRRAWQLLGTEARVAIEKPMLWVDLALTKIFYAAAVHPRPIRRFVIPDVSYPHEVSDLRDYVRDWGGVYETWRIERPGVAPIAEPHSSEVGRRTVQAARTVANGGTIDDLACNLFEAYCYLST